MPYARNRTPQSRRRVRGKELESGKVGPHTFTLRTMPQRIAEVGDLWADLRKRGRSLRHAIEKLRRLHGPP
jgi:DNA primase